MATSKHTNPAKSAEKADHPYYAGLTPLHRAALAQEMAGEVLDHFNHVRALVSALVTELQAQNHDDKAALQLATVTEAWINDRDHVSQQARLTDCLQAILDGAKIDAADPLTRQGA